MHVLVTGGAGYIGSTVCAALEDAGHVPIVLDSLVKGRVEFTRDRHFYQGDIADRALLARIFRDHPGMRHAIHCAALTVVPDSVARPYEYYYENVAKSLELFRTLPDLGCSHVVFSSSASVYGDTPAVQVTEDMPLNPRSPYARTKAMMEQVLQDFCRAYPMRGIALRYFNPIGADPRMRSGPYDPAPSLALGKLVAVAAGQERAFRITGTDWPTRDGTGIRDYFHVWDLALAHVRAIEQFDDAFARAETDEPYLVINLGTGAGVTVRELVDAFQRVYGHAIPIVEAPPRPGDVAGAYTSADRARRLLGWRADKSLDEGIADALAWEQCRATVLGAS